MDWSEFFASMFRVVIIVLGARIALWAFDYEIVKKNKYRWECTFCDLKASSSNREFITIVMADHQHNVAHILDTDS